MISTTASGDSARPSYRLSKDGCVLLCWLIWLSASRRRWSWWWCWWWWWWWCLSSLEGGELALKLSISIGQLLTFQLQVATLQRPDLLQQRLLHHGPAHRTGMAMVEGLSLLRTRPILVAPRATPLTLLSTGLIPVRW